MLLVCLVDASKVVENEVFDCFKVDRKWAILRHLVCFWSFIIQNSFDATVSLEGSFLLLFYQHLQILRILERKRQLGSIFFYTWSPLRFQMFSIFQLYHRPIFKICDFGSFRFLGQNYVAKPPHCFCIDPRFKFSEWWLGHHCPSGRLDVQKNIILFPCSSKSDGFLYTFWLKRRMCIVNRLWLSFLTLSKTFFDAIWE